MKLNLPTNVPHMPTSPRSGLIARAWARYNNAAIGIFLDPIKGTPINPDDCLYPLAEKLVHSASFADISDIDSLLEGTKPLATFEKHSLDAGLKKLALCAIYANKTDHFRETMMQLKPGNSVFAEKVNHAILVMALKERRNDIVQKLIHIHPPSHLAHSLRLLAGNDSDHPHENAAVNNFTGVALVYRHLKNTAPTLHDQLKTDWSARTVKTCTSFAALLYHLDGISCATYSTRDQQENYAKYAELISTWHRATGKLPYGEMRYCVHSVPVDSDEHLRCMEITPNSYSDAYKGILFFGTTENFAHYILHWFKPEGKIRSSWTIELCRTLDKDLTSANIFNFVHLPEKNPDPFYWRRWGEMLLQFGPKYVQRHLFSDDPVAALMRLEQQASSTPRTWVKSGPKN